MHLSLATLVNYSFLFIRDMGPESAPNAKKTVQDGEQMCPPILISSINHSEFAATTAWAPTSDQDEREDIPKRPTF